MPPTLSSSNSKAGLKQPAVGLRPAQRGVRRSSKGSALDRSPLSPSQLRPMPSPDMVRAARKIEELPSDGGTTVDTLAGGLLRTFIRLNQVEAAYQQLTRRVARLEGTDNKTANGGERSSHPNGIDENRGGAGNLL